MQRAPTMEGREDGLRHGLPSWPAHKDTLHAAGGAHCCLQQHKLRVRHPTRPATARARAPNPNTTTPPRARAPTPTATTRAARARARAGASRATGRRAETAEARQEEAPRPRPVRPRPATTAAAARTTAAARRAEPAQQRHYQRAGAGPRPRAGAGPGAAGVLPVHTVAAAEVGGDAEAARVLLRGVPVQLPDAGTRGDLQHRHGRQQAHHHLQRGEPQRLRDRVSALLSVVGEE